MVEVKATLSRKVWSSTKCLHVVAKESRNGSFFEAVEGVIVSVFVCVCASCDTSVGWMLFIHFAVRLELPSRLDHAPGAAALNGKAQQPLAVRHRPDKLVLTDKAEQLWSTTALHNTNANMLPWCSSIMFTTEI